MPRQLAPTVQGVIFARNGTLLSQLMLHLGHDRSRCAAYFAYNVALSQLQELLVDLVEEILFMICFRCNNFCHGRVVSSR